MRRTCQKSHTGRGHGASAANPDGRKLYALRKHTAEPVFGIIKSVMGFRQFLLRGHDAVRGEMEPRDHGVEYEAVVCPLPRLIGRETALVGVNHGYRLNISRNDL
jgi:hypothetical protein